MTVPDAPVLTPTAPAFDLDTPWMLHPGVSVRPESFGALLYHFGTRRLSFLKSRQLLAVVSALATSPDARTACATAGVGDAQLPAITRALQSLAVSETICPQPAEGPDPA